MIPLLYKIHSKKIESKDIVTLTLSPIHQSISKFKAGQFNMLYSFGVGEIPISISSTYLKNKGKSLTHTIKQVGRVSQRLCQLGAGDVIGVQGPFGTSWPTLKNGLQNKNNDTDLLMVGGGLGLAPLRPLIEELAFHRKKFRHVTLLYGRRSPEDIIFAEEIIHWRKNFNIKVEETVDISPPDWKGHIGMVGELIPQIDLDLSKTIAFLCGPEIMMRIVARDLFHYGLKENALYLSLERNMKCAIGHCGHCQLGPFFLCKDGPIFPWEKVYRQLMVNER